MSEIKVNKISPRSGTTVTLGDSGDTFTIPSGATINNQGTATNFGATGSASWNTTVKTSGFTAVAGEGYFCNTTSGGFSVNLPAGTAGAVVAIKDYAGTFDTGTLTLVQNGSDKIGGSTVNATLTTEGIAVTLVFIDSTQGWLVTDSGLQDEAPTAQYMVASGGTITTDGDFKVHTFTGPGAFCVSNAGNAAGSNEISYLVVAGGAGGSANGGGGGGAGGYREGKSPQTPYTASPLACTSGSNNGLPVAVASYPVTVGGGGPGVSSGRSTDGSVSTFAGTTTITSTGGGGSGSYCGSAAYDSPTAKGNPGGSGGGGGNGPSTTPSGLPDVPAANKGTGNTPPVSPSQGNPGGRGLHNPGYVPTGAVAGGGGGGAGGPGGEPVLNPGTGGAGGVGTPTQITGSAVSYAGGAGGGIGPGTGFQIPAGSPCGTGGAGGRHPSPAAVAGTTNRGGGGGGGGHQPQAGANGGSGIVIIRYKFQN